MKNKVVLFLCLFLIAVVPLLGQFSDITLSKNIDTALSTGNTKELATYFNKNIELATPEKTKIYSSKQAERVLDVFFLQNKPIAFEVQSERENIAGKKITGKMITVNSSYRVVYSVSGLPENQIILSLKFEKIDT